jgi:hypothetical protein
MSQLAGVVAAVCGLVVCMLLPYLPGRHDVLAVTLSSLAQVLGILSLLLVPVGAVWLLHASFATITPRTHYRYTRTAIQLLTAVGCLGALAGAMQNSIVLAIACATASLALGWRAMTRSKQRVTAAQPSRTAAVCCLVAPVVLVLIQWAIAEPATEYARSRAIENSSTLLADIEQFHATRGHYPPSLHSIHEDYPTSVIGVNRYYYEPNGEAYNLFFEQPSFLFGARVIVMYNPRDEQTMTSHNQDLLLLTPAELDRQRGFFRVAPATQPHWKYFIFD